MGERITIELDSEALEAAREANVNLSELLISALRRRLPKLHAANRENAAQQWYEENKTAIDSYNAFEAQHGLFSDHVRKF